MGMVGSDDSEQECSACGGKQYDCFQVPQGGRWEVCQSTDDYGAPRYRVAFYPLGRGIIHRSDWYATRDEAAAQAARLNAQNEEG